MQYLKNDTFFSGLLPSADLLMRLARQTRLFQRTPRKISPLHLVLGVLISIAERTPHFRGIAKNISSFGSGSPSRQAVWARLRIDFAPSFFAAVFKRVIDAQYKRISSLTRLPTQLGETFTRVLVEDGSVLPLHASLAKTYKGSSNQHGTVAALRLRWVFDLLTGKTIDADLHLWRSNDMSTAYDILPMLKQGDLLLRDMGYFCFECFHRIAKIGAFYVTRIPEGTAVYFIGAGRAGLVGQLRKAKKQGIRNIEWSVIVGTENSVSGRLVAMQVDDVKSAERRRKLRAEYRDKGQAPTAGQLEKCDWVIVFTNVPTETLSSTQVADLYRARWMVEIFFKGLKSGQCLEKWSRHRTNENTILCLAYGHMILGVLSLNLWRKMGEILDRKVSGDIDSQRATPADVSTTQRRFIGPLKAMESIIPFLIDVFKNRLSGAEKMHELMRLTRYTAQEKRARQSLDAILSMI